jgi:hypothetical protein
VKGIAVGIRPDGWLKCKIAWALSLCSPHTAWGMSW